MPVFAAMSGENPRKSQDSQFYGRYSYNVSPEYNLWSVTATPSVRCVARHLDPLTL